MGDVIQLSSDDEENKGKLRKEKSPRKGDNVRKNPGSKGVLGESLSTESKKNVPRSGSKSSGKKLCDGMKTDGAAGESWSAFQKFIQFCHDTEVHRRNGDPSLSNKICSKLSERYKKADPEFTQSETFRDLLKSVGNVVKQDPKNLYVHMRQVHDELHIRSVKQKNNNHKRKAGEAEDDNHSSKRSKTTASDSSGDPEDESKAVNQGHCKKLERLFTKVYRKVKQLEEKEVDWDDEVNSNYIRLETYKKRLWAIWEKWQEARGHSDEVKKLKHQKIAFSGTLYPALDHTIEKYLNKTKCFPDFVDIFKLTSETLNKEKEFSEEQIKSIASAAFQILGNQLQKRRVYDFWNCCLSYLPSASDGLVSVSDPADNDAELAKALRENKEKYNRKISDVIDSFVEKQDDEKHEPEEVVLNSDDETSTHSGDEDESEEDKPEDIINISSTSSENSGGETDVDEKKPKSNSGKPKTNGVGIKEESTSDSDSDHTPDYIPLGASTSKDSPGCSGVMKKALVVKVEKCVVPSTSGVRIKKSSSSEFSKKKIDKKAEVVTLSESDSSGE